MEFSNKDIVGTKIMKWLTKKANKIMNKKEKEIGVDVTMKNG